MSSVAITSLVAELLTVTLPAADTTQTERYQDELFFELSRLAKPGVLIQIGAAFVAGVKGQVQYALPPTPEDARSILTVHWDDRQLALTRKSEAEATDPGWRKALGTPLGFLADPVDRTAFFVIPPADRDGAAIGSLTPFDSTWPDSNVTVLHTRTDLSWPSDTDNYLDTDLAVAFEVVARELARDSAHKDPDASGVATQMADLFWQLSFMEYTGRG